MRLTINEKSAYIYDVMGLQAIVPEKTLQEGIKSIKYIISTL